MSWRAAGAATLVLALVAGGLALRAQVTPQAAPVPLPVPGPATSGPAHDAPSPAPGADPGEVVVHVVGAVAAPGLVRLPVGARAGDALAAVGGAGPDADLAAVNLARVVTDGEQIVVPVAGAAPAPGAPVQGAPVRDDGLVDLNTADEAALQELPGVGPVLAGRIVEHRSGQPFTTVDELDDVPGIGPALMADLRARVRV